MRVNAIKAGELVDRSERRIREWIRTGKLRAVKVGGEWCIDLEDLARVPWVTMRPPLVSQVIAAVPEAPTAFPAILERLEALERFMREQTKPRATVRLGSAKVKTPTRRARPGQSGMVLTAAEISVAELMSFGFTRSQVASSLHCTTKTVKNHIYSINGKLGVVNTNGQLDRSEVRRIYRDALVKEKPSPSRGGLWLVSAVESPSAQRAPGGLIQP